MLNNTDHGEGHQRDVGRFHIGQRSILRDLPLTKVTSSQQSAPQMSLQDRRARRNSKQPELCKQIKRMLKDER